MTSAFDWSVSTVAGVFDCFLTSDTAVRCTFQSNVNQSNIAFFERKKPPWAREGCCDLGSAKNFRAGDTPTCRECFSGETEEFPPCYCELIRASNLHPAKKKMEIPEWLHFSFLGLFV